MTLQDLLHKVVGQPASYYKKNEYEFGNVLGAGAFGVVRQAKNKHTDEKVAIKVILRRMVGKVKGGDDAVHGELNLLRQLDCPHIVQFKDWFESRDKYYMVTQLCTGGELFDRIIDEGRFTEEDAARCMYEVADAIQYLHHRNIVHRDIKPENLLYVDEKKESLVLADFGVAKTLTSADEKIMSAAGSLCYAAPEIFTGEGHGKPCDVWSFGVVLYTVLSGYSPFKAESVEQFMSEVSPGFKVRFHERYWKHVSQEARDLISDMIQYDPDKRPTIDQVIADPWFNNSFDRVDLLPSIKPGLRARVRWKLAFEKVALSKRLAKLELECSDEEGETKKPPRFKLHEVVMAAQRNNDLLKQAQSEAPNKEEPVSGQTITRIS